MSYIVDVIGIADEKETLETILEQLHRGEWFHFELDQIDIIKRIHDGPKGGCTYTFFASFNYGPFGEFSDFVKWWNKNIVPLYEMAVLIIKPEQAEMRVLQHWSW